jgi:hypothetical protein
MRPGEVFFIEELPDDKNAFNVAVHEWQKRTRWLKIKLAAVLFVLFSCFAVPAGGVYIVSQYVSFGVEQQDEHRVLLPLVVQGPVVWDTLGDSYDQ